MKWFIFRIIEAPRVGGGVGYVVQVAPPWFMRWAGGWQDAGRGLNHKDIEDAREERARCEAVYNGSRGRVVE